MVNVQRLIQNLAHANGLTIYSARGDFEHIKDVSAVPELIRGLKHESYEVRAYCAIALGNLGEGTAVPALCKALKYGSFSAFCAAEALEKIKDGRAVEALIGALEGPRETVRKAAAGALGTIGSISAVDALKTAAEDEDSSVRNCAINALGKIATKNPKAAETKEIIAILIDKLQGVASISAAGALGNIGDASATPALAKVAKGYGTYAPQYAVRALGKIGEKADMEGLVGALGGKSRDAVLEAREVLLKKGSEAVPALIKGWGSGGNWKVRQNCRELLWEIKPNMGDLGLVRNLAKKRREEGGEYSELLKLHKHWSGKLSKKAASCVSAAKNFPKPKVPGKPGSVKRVKLKRVVR